MDVFLLSFTKVLPLYVIAAIGYLAAKTLKLDFETLSKLFFYVFLPVVVFYGAYKVPIASGGLLIPIVYFFLATFVSLVFFVIGKLIFKDKTSYLLGLTAGSSNVGNFGIPLSVAILGMQALGPAVMAVLGFALWWNTVGFFIASKGHYSTKETLKKILRLPSLYAFFLGIFFQIQAVQLSQLPVASLIEDFVHAYNVLGFMIVGVGMAHITKEALDRTFITLSLVAKFLVWPLTAAAIIAIDSQTFRAFTPLTYKVFFLQSLCPIALNTINVASLVKLYPEKASLAVTISTLLAIIYIPVIVTLFI